MPCHESDTDDAILVFQTLKGEDTAFSRFFLRYYDRFRAHAHRPVLDAHLADETTQETFIRAASRLAGLRNQHSIGGWLFRISGNLSRDRLLSRVTLVERNAEIAKFEFLLSQPAVQHDTDSDLVRQAVRRLPPKRREVVALVSIKKQITCRSFADNRGLRRIHSLTETGAH